MKSLPYRIGDWAYNVCQKLDCENISGIRWRVFCVFWYIYQVGMRIDYRLYPCVETQSLEWDDDHK